MHIYPHGFAHLRTAYQGLVRPLAQIIRLVTKRTSIQELFMTNQFWEELWCLLGELQGPKRHQIPKSIQNNRKMKMVGPPDPNLRTSQ